jgi:U3 small nucleolar RNA-associated protein 18
LGTASTKPA